MGSKFERWTTIGLILGIQICLLLSITLSFLAMSSDREWERILEGELKFPIQTGFFANKSLDLDMEEWHQEKDLLHRPVVLITLYVVLSILVKVSGFSHLLLFCIIHCCQTNGGIFRNPGKGTRLTILCIYVILGVILLVAASLMASSSSEYEDNYVKLMNLFYVRLQKESDDHSPKKQDYRVTPLGQLDETMLLMDICGICIGTSLHYAFHPNDNFPVPLLSEIKMVDEQVYDGSTLSDIRFCQLEVYKVVAVVFGVNASVLCFTLASFNAWWLWRQVAADKAVNKQEMQGLGDIWNNDDKMGDKEEGTYEGSLSAVISSGRLLQ